MVHNECSPHSTPPKPTTPTHTPIPPKPSTSHRCKGAAVHATDQQPKPLTTLSPDATCLVSRSGDKPSPFRTPTTIATRKARRGPTSNLSQPLYRRPNSSYIKQRCHPCSSNRSPRLRRRALGKGATTGRLETSAPPPSCFTGAIPPRQQGASVVRGISTVAGRRG